MANGKVSKPYGTALDAKERIWIGETGQYPNQLVGFDTRQQKIIGSTRLNVAVVFVTCILIKRVIQFGLLWIVGLLGE
jgi:hypothetical protein